jgi:imidazoleglycerol-phosphate dehydratase/histidinol-phosphatase
MPAEKRKLLFIDRDGTILVEPKDNFQVDSIEKFRFLPGVVSALAAVARSGKYELVLVTNQDGLGTACFPEEQFWPPQNLMMQVLETEGVHFSAVHIDRSFEADNIPTRKPGTGMLQAYMNGSIDPENSYVIGDRITDAVLAKNLGCRAILIKYPGGYEEDTPGRFQGLPIPEKYAGDFDPNLVDLVANHWEQVKDFLIQPRLKATVHRNTNETQIAISVNLYGTGKCQINTGLGFFDHMLEQVARHGGIDLDIGVKGDLHIDEHHTIEDTGLALGEAFRKALGDKKGIYRYGFVLPMDEAEAHVSIDFSGRSWLVWNADFKREKIGEMPTEMFFHFFKSFTDEAKCTLHINCKGENEHHKIEAIFKGFAKACRMAIEEDKRFASQLPSTKGVL